MHPKWGRMIASEYARSGHKSVSGWLRPEAAVLITWLAERQRVGGNVAEIGVHHGKLFLLLHLLRAPGERSVAIDLFERQDLNVDSSGWGDRTHFERNLDAVAGGRSDVVVLPVDSRTVNGADLLDLAGGAFRLFSIDGGHTAELTEHDLGTAAGALTHGGLLILDDYFNEQWPGVSEGTTRFPISQHRSCADRQWARQDIFDHHS